MTAQIPDSIIIDGVNLSLLSNPLDTYLNALPEKPKFNIPHTAYWRGYVATWALDNNTLCLSILNGSIGLKRVGISHLFSTNDNIKAEWFTGYLRIPISPIRYYVHSGYASLYPKELSIQINKGNVEKIILKEQEIDNKTFEVISKLEYEISQDEMEHEIRCYRIIVEQNLSRVYTQSCDDKLNF